MRILKVITIVCIAGMLACSSARDTGAKKIRRSQNVIYEEEIKKNTTTFNVFDLIQKLRPHWLRGRGQKSVLIQEASIPVVYVNRIRYGLIDSLHNISIADVTEIHYLNAGDAAFRFGPNHSGGAILITVFR